MDYISRIQEQQLRRFINEPDGDRNVLLVEGARQTGKTTLVERTIAAQALPVVALNLEQHRRIRARLDTCVEFDDMTLVLRDECGFDPSRPGIVFIDESQESERLGGFVRFMKEQWTMTRTILSGSTLTRLFRGEQRFPVGRVSRLLVTPFSFHEFLYAVHKDFLAEHLAQPSKISAVEHEALVREYDRFLLVGGLPAVIAALVENRDWRALRGEVIAGYDDDLKRLFGEHEMDTVRAALRAVAALIGSGFRNTCVAPSMSSSRNQFINHVLSRLEDWKLVLKSEQQGMDPLHAYHYHPKRYLFDTGVVRDMRESAVPSLNLLDRRDPAVRTALGGVIENQLAIDLARFGGQLAGWKKSSAGLEIDFVIKAGETAVPVECKASLVIKGTHLEGVKGYLRLYGVRTGVIASLAPYRVIDCGDDMRVVNIPLYCAQNVREIVDVG